MNINKIYTNNSNINVLYIGNKLVEKVYCGTELIYSIDSEPFKFPLIFQPNIVFGENE